MTAPSGKDLLRGFMASPHPTEGKCFHPDCGGPITDIWCEFLEQAAEKAAVSLGQADFTCPYCHRSLRFDLDRSRGRGSPHDPGEQPMNAPFSPAEIDYLIAWARADHEGRADGPA